MIEIHASNELKVNNIPYDVAEQIVAELTIPNPQYAENARYGRWNGQTPENLELYKYEGNGLSIPRGFVSRLFNILINNELEYKVFDNRFTLPQVDFISNINLKSHQVDAVNSLRENDFGVLSAPTGSGKTVMACHVIAQRRQPTIVVVHTKELLKQWVLRIETFLGIPKKEIGILGAGKNTIGKRVTVGMVQTLRKRDISGYFGHMVVDECHRVPSKTFSEVVFRFTG